MSKPKTVLGLFGAFLAGCLATQVAPLVVPPARAGTSPQRWEYACLQSQGPRVNELGSQTAAVMNTYGQQGWELASALGGTDVQTPTWCFKRPLP